MLSRLVQLIWVLLALILSRKTTCLRHGGEILRCGLVCNLIRLLRFSFHSIYPRLFWLSRFHLFFFLRQDQTTLDVKSSITNAKRDSTSKGIVFFFVF